MWQWALTIARLPTALDHLLHQRAELLRLRVADRVGHVDDRCARPATAASKASAGRQLGARGVLGAELDVVARARPARAPARRRCGCAPGRPRGVVRSLWVMWMSLVAMKTWSCRLRAGSRAAAATSRPRPRSAPAPRSPAHRPPPTSLGDAPHRLRLAGRGRREARLDDVHPEARELLRDADLLVDGQAAPGACSPSRRVVSKTRMRQAIRQCPRRRRSACSAAPLGPAHPAALRVDEAHVARSSPPTGSIGRLALLGRRRLNSGAPRCPRRSSASRTSRPGSRQDPLHLGADLGR